MIMISIVIIVVAAAATAAVVAAATIAAATTATAIVIGRVTLEHLLFCEYKSRVSGRMQQSRRTETRCALKLRHAVFCFVLFW